MTEEELLENIYKGQRAKEMLENPLFMEIFEGTKDTMIAAFISEGRVDDIKADWFRMSKIRSDLQAVVGLNNRLCMYKERGADAAQQLDEMRSRKDSSTQDDLLI